MTDFGITATGFVPKTVQDIYSEITASALAEIDPNLDTSPEQPVGQLLGLCARREGALWELLVIAFNAMNPDAAEGFLQENLCALTGVRRLPSTQSRLKDVSVTLDAGATLPAGSLAAVLNEPTRQFASEKAVTAVAAGDYPVDFLSVAYGPVPANAGTLTVIAAPVTGWSAVTNPTDALPGREEETDTEMRIRREASVQAAGGSGIDHIRADLLAMNDGLGMESAVVYENTRDYPDAFGRPGHSIEAVIFDGLSPAFANDEIAQVLWDSKGSGAATYGDLRAHAIDATGATQNVRFNRAEQVPIYFDLTLTVDVGIVIADIAPDVKEAMVTAGRLNRKAGDSVIALAMRAAALKVSGVLDVPTFALDVTASPVAMANLTMTLRQIATFDTSRITVA